MEKKFYQQEVITHFDFKDVNIGDLVAWEYPKTQSYYQETQGQDPEISDIERDFVEKTYAGTRVAIVSKLNWEEDEISVTEVYPLPEGTHEELGVKKKFNPKTAQGANLRFVADVSELKDYLLELTAKKDEENLNG